MILKWCFIVSLLFKESLFENYPVKQYVFKRKVLFKLFPEWYSTRVEIEVKLEFGEDEKVSGEKFGGVKWFHWSATEVGHG